MTKQNLKAGKLSPSKADMSPGVEFGTYYPIAFEEETPPTEIQDPKGLVSYEDEPISSVESE